MQFLAALCFVVALTTSNLFSGDFSGGNRNVVEGAAFISLARGAESLDGTVVDESASYRLKDLCFGGVTKISNLRKEGQDTTSEMDLQNIKEIELIEGRFQSKDLRLSATREYPIFVKAKVTPSNGQSEEFLFPYKTVISGRDPNSNIGRAWFLRDVNKINIHGAYKEPFKPVEPGKGQPVKKLSWWQKIIPGT